MTLEERIKNIKTWINDYFDDNICDWRDFIDFSVKNEKIIISVNKKRYFVRERRKGRGIQARRIVNLLVKRAGGKLLFDEKIILGKNRS